MADHPAILLHLAPRREWEEAQRKGAYRAPSLEKEGFIHCSRLPQILAVANRYYAGRKDLVLLQIDAGRLSAEVRWEASGAEIYPHIYGPVDLEAVRAVDPYLPDVDGVFRKLPEIGLSDRR